MNGTDDIRGSEYGALMHQVRELGRTSQLCWTVAAVAAAALLSGAIAARNPGLMLPVELCVALGFYATVHAREQTKRIVGYVQEFHEKDREDAQWFTRLAHLHTLPGFQDRSEWVPFALANAVTLVAVVYSWVFAHGAAHGELMAAVATMAGMAFSVHSMVEHIQSERVQAAAPWDQMSGGLRGVTTAKRVTSGR